MRLGVVKHGGARSGMCIGGRREKIMLLSPKYIIVPLQE